MKRRRLSAWFPALVVFGSACGSSTGTEITLTAAGQAGLQVVRTKGCASCHGSTGQGGVGPTFVGLFGSERILADGSVVIADIDYLRRAITDPQDEQLADYGFKMPTNNLDDEQVSAVIDFITELAAPSQKETE